MSFCSTNWPLTLSLFRRTVKSDLSINTKCDQILNLHKSILVTLFVLLKSDLEV